MKEFCAYKCKLSIILAIIGPIAVSFIAWMALTLHAQSAEVAVTRDRLSDLTEHVKEIKEILKEAAKKAK